KVSQILFRALCREPEHARNPRHIAPLTALAFRRDQRPANLARRPPPCREEGAFPICVAFVDFCYRARLARVCPLFALSLSSYPIRTSAASISKISMAQGCRDVESLAEGTNRVPDRRCRNARALDDRLDAQPRSNDSGLISCER